MSLAPRFGNHGPVSLPATRTRTLGPFLPCAPSLLMGPLPTAGSPPYRHLRSPPSGPATASPDPPATSSFWPELASHRRPPNADSLPHHRRLGRTRLMLSPSSLVAPSPAADVQEEGHIIRPLGHRHPNQTLSSDSTYRGLSRNHAQLISEIQVSGTKQGLYDCFAILHSSQPTFSLL